MQEVQTGFVAAATLDELRRRGYLTAQINGQTVALFYHQDQVYAVDNRCPHMGFPLDRGTVRDGILTCHWHHARFDLASGGTFDQWADDVRAFPVEVHNGQVYVDTSPRSDQTAHYRERLQIGLERDLSLVIGKAVLALLDAEPSGLEAFRSGLAFGTRYRGMGWGQGLTMHVCMMNLLPTLNDEERPRALYHGLSAVARDTANRSPHFGVPPLPGESGDLPTLKRWFRQFIEVRDAEGAERCIVSAIRAGADDRQMADMLFSAVTDHRYIDIGHPADFTNKALEALDITGWDLAEPVLTSLVNGYANAARMEESNAWRYPVDLIALLEQSFETLPAAVATGADRRAAGQVQWMGRRSLAALLLEDDPQASAAALLDSLAGGCAPDELASAVVYAAALRIARFHTSNEFGDWDTALHTFTFANAVHQGLRRAPSVDLLRGVFDAAMSVYLDRFLNIPAARLPQPNGAGSAPDASLPALSRLLDRQQQVNPAAQEVAAYLQHHGDSAALVAWFGRLLLREDRDFHTIQMIEAAVRQHSLLDDLEERSHMLIAAIRYLAAHAPTVRSQGQTYTIAQRLHHGERLFEED